MSFKGTKRSFALLCLCPSSQLSSYIAFNVSRSSRLSSLYSRRSSALYHCSRPQTKNMSESCSVNEIDVQFYKLYRNITFSLKPHIELPIKTFFFFFFSICSCHKRHLCLNVMTWANRFDWIRISKLIKASNRSLSPWCEATVAQRQTGLQSQTFWIHKQCTAQRGRKLSIQTLRSPPLLCNSSGSHYKQSWIFWKIGLFTVMRDKQHFINNVAILIMYNPCYVVAELFLWLSGYYLTNVTMSPQWS